MIAVQPTRRQLRSSVQFVVTAATAETMRNAARATRLDHTRHASCFGAQPDAAVCYRTITPHPAGHAHPADTETDDDTDNQWGRAVTAARSRGPPPALEAVDHAAQPIALAREGRAGKPAVRGGDVEHRADLAEAAKRDSEVMKAIAAIAAVSFGEVEQHAIDGVGALLGERGVVAPHDRERGPKAADRVEGEVIGEKAHGEAPGGWSRPPRDARKEP
jgi:hypothetical protein